MTKIVNRERDLTEKVKAVFDVVAGLAGEDLPRFWMEFLAAYTDHEEEIEGAQKMYEDGVITERMLKQIMSGIGEQDIEYVSYMGNAAYEWCVAYLDAAGMEIDKQTGMVRKKNEV